ncbi:MAG: CocE/NonD family hydrolase, partial [Pyrinomonadaceae bacterium]|nr:CocE/NonD family hydrolase [Pyrinomonadaceae bacterium]
TSSGIINSHPAIKAASPQAPVSDWFIGDDMHHNGAFFLAQNYDFFAGFGQPRPKPETPETTKNKEFDFGTKDGYKFFKDTMGSLANSDDLYRKNVGTDIAFWNQMMAHPNYDQFWKDRNILTKLKNIKCAVMTVGGWYDNEDLYGALETYKSIEANNPGIYNVLVVGPWYHGGWARSDGEWLGTAYFGQKTGAYYREKLELPFFNHYLKEKGDLGDLKEINVFDTGANKWAFYDKPVTGTEKIFYLQADGKLSPDAPMKDRSSFDEYVSDPSKPVPYTKKITINYPRDFMTEDQRFVSNRSDVLTYQTEVLTEDVTVAGDIKPTLFASTSGTDSDYVVKLIDVFPDDAEFPKDLKLTPEASNGFELSGYQMLLRGEPFRARFRNSFEKPEPMEANRIAKIVYTMPAIEHTFKKGHRIMVQIQSSWFPLVDRNPQTYVPNIFEAKEIDFKKATQRIYRNGANPSSVALRIIPTK